MMRLLSKFDPWVIKLRADMTCTEDGGARRNVTTMVQAVLTGARQGVSACGTL
jgi:hypothetical protein